MRMHGKPVICFLLLFGVTLLLSSLFCAAVWGVHPESLAIDEPAPSSIEDQETPLSEGFAEERAPSRFPGWKDKLSSLPPFLRDTRLNLHLRSYYFDRRRQDGRQSQAWALGGWVDYASGRWKNIFQIGAVAYTSQRLYGPEDKGGTQLLKPVQEGFSALGQAYLDARVMEGLHLRVYRQTFELPYVNKHDNRMVPNTFEALSLVGRSIHQTDFIVGHVSKMKTRNSDEFRYMSEVAGFPGTKKGLTMGGARYRFTKDFNLGFINQYGWDLWNTLYGEANYTLGLTEAITLAVSAQYTDQRSVGEALAGAFNTHVFGGQAEIGYHGNIFSAAFSTTGTGSRIRTPFGSYPGYLSLIVKDFDRAGEDAWSIGLSSHFGFLGLENISAFANYAQGNTPDQGVYGSPDQSELDVTMDYRINQGLLQTLFLRFRAAFVRQDGPNSQDLDEYRIILNFDLPVL